MMFGRKLKTAVEKAHWNLYYNRGMENGWASGAYAIADGDYITEDDRLNKKSISVIDDIDTLEAFFKAGNWCLGCSVMYKNLCFINQINGGDEWLTMTIMNGKAVTFESITFGPMIERGEFKKYVDSLTRRYVKNGSVEYDYYQKKDKKAKLPVTSSKGLVREHTRLLPSGKKIVINKGVKKLK